MTHPAKPAQSSDPAPPTKPIKSSIQFYDINGNEVDSLKETFHETMQKRAAEAESAAKSKAIPSFFMPSP